MTGIAKKSNAYAPRTEPSRGPGICIHCALWAKRFYGRQLCWSCRKQPDIVRRYPVLPSNRRPNRKTKAPPDCVIELLPDEGPDKPRLPALSTYPCCKALLRCVHDLIDGACPACEREQRAGMVFRYEVAEDNGD